ncbi:MAG: DNA-binding domain-containing protein [Candidatus Thiodiazotropha sp.]
MLSLAELQSAFCDVSLGGDTSILSDVIIPDGFAPEQRLQVHCNNTTILLTEALVTTYRIVHELVGEDFFTQVARQFIRAHPPATPCLFEYGAGFSELLRSLPALSEIAYIADVAQLEWQWNSAFFAEEAAPLSVEILAAISPEELEGHQLHPHPTTRLVTSAYPIKQIWDMHQDGADPDAGVNLDDGSEAVLIVRPHAEVELHLLSTNADILASCLISGATIGEAFGVLETTEDAAHLPVLFAELIATNMFDKIR